jgi:hypothetical protein
MKKLYSEEELNKLGEIQWVTKFEQVELKKN